MFSEPLLAKVSLTGLAGQMEMFMSNEQDGSSLHHNMCNKLLLIQAGVVGSVCGPECESNGEMNRSLPQR